MQRLTAPTPVGRQRNVDGLASSGKHNWTVAAVHHRAVRIMIDEAHASPSDIDPATSAGAASMLKRRNRIERLNKAMLDAEARITEQVLRIVAMEARGDNAGESRRALRAFEDILVEYLTARASIVEARKLTGRPAG